MRGKVVIAGCALLLVVALLLHHHLQRSVPVVTPKPPERVSTPRQPRPRLPAPRIVAGPLPVESAAENEPSTNWWGRFLKSETTSPQPTAEQLQPYLEKHHRSAESLLAAFHATKNPAFLREAMETHPDDPRVALAAYYKAEPYDNEKPASPERRQWLEAFAKSAPDNALPNYLGALDCFKAGQTDQAVQELFAASQKSQFQDYSREFLLNAAEAYQAAGWPDVEAMAACHLSMPVMHWSDLREIVPKLVELAGLYRQGGDEASAQAVVQIGLGLGQRLTEPGEMSFVQESASIAIERSILRTMDPNSLLAGTGQTVQSQLDALNQRRVALRTLGQQADEFLPTLSDADAARYFERARLFGDIAAVQWLVRTYGK